MATMAKWGSKKWSVSSTKIIALEDLAFSYTQIADENDSTEDKSTTNSRGTELFPLSFTTKLVAGTGVDVRQEIKSWKALVTKTNYFYLNGKKLFPKMLQLRQVSVSDVTLDNLGRMRTAKLSFTFKEYDKKTTSVKVTSSAKKITASSDEKKAKITTNIQLKKAAITEIKVGSYVKMIGSTYTTGQTIPDAVKLRSFVVSKISGNEITLEGISNRVKVDEVTLVK